jgi:hypothetical protein
MKLHVELNLHLHWIDTCICSLWALDALSLSCCNKDIMNTELHVNITEKLILEFALVSKWHVFVRCQPCVGWPINVLLHFWNNGIVWGAAEWYLDHLISASWLMHLTRLTLVCLDLITKELASWPGPSDRQAQRVWGSLHLTQRKGTLMTGP